MKYFILNCCVFFSIGMVNCQNLVPNPSFELCQKCDNRGFKELYIGEGANTPIDWTAATFGTSDIRSEFPRTGKRHGGFFLGIPKFEYLTTKLTQPLIAGYTYRCIFHIRLQELNAYYALDQFGVHFHTGIPNYPQAEPLSQLNLQYETPNDEYISDYSYKNYSFNFVACGGEDHIILGRFKKIGIGDTLFVGKDRNINPNQAAVYYFVDDISVELIDSAVSNIVVDQINLCEGETKTVEIPDSIKLASILWSTGETSRKISIPKVDTLWVEYKFDDKCASIRETIKINRKLPPTLSISGDQFICTGKSTILTAFCNSCSSITWNTNESTNQITVSSAGTYSVKAKWECGEITESKTIKAQSTPKFEIETKGTICNNNQLNLIINFEDTPTCDSIVWNNGAKGILQKASSFGLYSAKAYCECGIYSDSIIINPCDKIIKFPNVFISQSEIDENESFGPYIDKKDLDKIISFTLTVYNRFGNKVFETADIQKRYIPETNDVSQTFIYYAEINFAKELNLPKESHKGEVTFIK